jgi:hypothetical protein
LKDNNKQKKVTSEWGHKVFRLVNDDNLSSPLMSVDSKAPIDHIKIDDLQYESEALKMEGWRYQMGFALDDDSIYLFYKKPLNRK